MALDINTNGQKLDRIRKQLHSLFKKEGLKITVELFQQSVDILDVFLDHKNKSFRPHKKPLDNPQYIHIKSNHPPIIKKTIPAMIEKRLSSLSSDRQSFESVKRDYDAALKTSG